MSNPPCVIVRRPRAIVFDILGTASKSGFLEKILFPFLKNNLEGYIENHWNDKEFKRLYNLMITHSQEANQTDNNVPILLPIDKPNAKSILMAYMDYVTQTGINSPPMSQLRFKVWFDGYQQSKIRTPIYSDVPNNLRRWFAEGIKFYVASNTWIDAQKALLKNTNHGDLTNLISGHYDNDFGALNDPLTWRRFATDINEEPQEILFLTKSTIEARAAADAGLAVVLVLTHRHNVKAVGQDDRRRFRFVRTLNELMWAEGETVGAIPTERTNVQQPMIPAPSSDNQTGQSSGYTNTSNLSSSNKGGSGVSKNNNNTSGVTEATNETHLPSGSSHGSSRPSSKASGTSGVSSGSSRASSQGRKRKASNSNSGNSKVPGSTSSGTKKASEASG